MLASQSLLQTVWSRVLVRNHRVELADATAQTDHYIAAFGFRIEEMRHIALVSF